MISNRIRQVQSPVIPIVGRWTAETPGTISLGQGIVNYAPPTQVFQAIRQTSFDDLALHRYSGVAGDPRVQELVAEKLKRENKIDVALQGCEVFCTAGANMGFLNAVLAIADVDDEIILLNPYYFNHHMAIEIAGCRVIAVDTNADQQPDLDAIGQAVTPRTKAVVTVSPNNPTGAVYRPSDLMAINRLCADRGIYHISDEAYEYFLYDEQEHFSAGSLPDAGGHTLSLYSLSKSYGLAGWRIGYSVVPNHLMTAMRKIQDTNLICPPTICQVAARAALEVGSDWCRAQSQGFQQVRDAAIQRIQELGARCQITHAQGAFYLFLTLQSDQDDLQLVESLIREHKIATLPGSAFGMTDRCSIRISYGALDADSVLDGVGRLVDGLHSLLP